MSLKKKLLTFLGNQDLDEFYLSELVNRFSDNTIQGILSDLKSYRGNEETTEEETTIDESTEENSAHDANDTYYVFSDGNCKRNGSVNCIAGYSVLFTEDPNSSLYKFNCTKVIVANPTNNKAELSGIKKICKTIYDNYKEFYNKKIIICTDSNYSINCVTTWYLNWIENDWITSKGEPVKNKELISSIVYLINKLKKANIIISFQHVNSHMPEPINKKSIDWILWRGNAIVDRAINILLAKAKEHVVANEPAPVKQTNTTKQPITQTQVIKQQPAKQQITKQQPKKLIIEKRG
jgi:ribonuclease HI